MSQGATDRSGEKAPRRLRVLILARIPRRAAFENYVPGTRPNPLDLWQMLAERGINVELMDPTPWPLNPFAGSHSLYQSIDPYRSLKVLLTCRHFDLVIVAGEGGAVLLALLRRLFRFKTPILAWDLSPDTVWRLRSRVQDYVLPRIEGILTIQSSQVPYIAERWGSHVRALVVGYMIDTDFYQPQYNEPPEYILAVGDDLERDFPTLLAAMEGISSELIIKTKLELPLDPHKHSLVRQIAERLEFPAFRSLYARSRFVVLPLKPHPLNASGVTTLAEAFAMGKAVIVSSSDGIRDFLVPDENCLMVPAHDVDALRAAIERLLREPETCERLGRSARQFAEEHFSKPVFARHFAETLRCFCS